MTVDNSRRLSANRYVSEDAHDEAGAHCNAIDGRDDRLVAIDDVVDEVFGFLPGRHAGHRIVENALDQLKIAAGRKSLAGSGDDDGVDIGILIDVAPDMGQLGVGFGINGVVGFRPIEGEPQNSLRRVFDLQLGVGGVSVGHYTPLLSIIGQVWPFVRLWASRNGSFRTDVRIKFDRTMPQGIVLSRSIGRHTKAAPLVARQMTGELKGASSLLAG